MTPSERAWIEARIAEWSEKAAQWRRIACTREAPINRAFGLESVVRRLQARLDAAAPAPTQAPSAALGRYEAEEIARMQGCLERWREMDGPLTNAMRSILIAKLAAVGITQAERKPTIFERMSEMAAAARSIPAIPEPFTMGPQMDLFG